MRFYLLLFFLFSAGVQAASSELLQMSQDVLGARQSADMRAVQRYRDGLERTMAFVQIRPDLFPRQRISKRLLTDASKHEVRSIWKALLDYHMALEAMEQLHKDFVLLPNAMLRERSLLLTYAAHLARYRFALDFIARAENDPELGKVLNEPVREFGLAKGTYDRFKLHFLNVGIGTQFAALNLLYKGSGVQAEPALAGKLDADSQRIWEFGRGKGEKLTAKNAGKIVQGLAQRAIFPAQAGISEWMGDTKVLRQDRALISEQQIADMTPQMRPGDVMLQRREWYFSNVGLPGFWSHAALYIGTPKDRRAFFKDAAVRAWVQQQGMVSGDLEDLLQQRFPEAYKTSLMPQEHQHVPRVLEAISEGVSFTTMEHSAAADSLVVLRPRLSKVELAMALVRAFGYAGRPYDFDFDFQTDATLVCTELIYKAYEPAQNFKGIRMQPQEIVGRLAIPANGIAQTFDEEYGTPKQQWDMVLFLDGNEREKRAVVSDLSTFRNSWQRPKWHVLIQATKNGHKAL